MDCHLKPQNSVQLDSLSCCPSSWSIHYSEYFRPVIMLRVRFCAAIAILSVGAGAFESPGSQVRRPRLVQSTLAPTSELVAARKAPCTDSGKDSQWKG